MTLNAFLKVSIVAGVCAAFAGISQAAERPLTSNQIRAWLTDATAFSTGDGPAWAQYFDADGSTPYWAKGSDESIGHWSVRQNQYCSRWPPNNEWTCYVMTGEETVEGRTITFVSPSGHKSPARLVPGRQKVE